MIAPLITISVGASRNDNHDLSRAPPKGDRTTAPSPSRTRHRTQAQFATLSAGQQLRKTTAMRDGKVDFDRVLELGASLPGIKASASAKGIALKLGGRLVACTAIHPSAEPNSVMVCIDFPARDSLLAKQPDTYYMTPHYRGYATVLVRLAKIGRHEMLDLLKEAAQFVSAKAKKTPRRAEPRQSQRS